MQCFRAFILTYRFSCPHIAENLLILFAFGPVLANFCNYRPLAVTRPSFAVRIKKKGLLDGNSGEILTELVVLF